MAFTVEAVAKYSAAIAYLTVTNASGDPGIGTAFHVGQGVFVTARHVVEGCSIDEVATVRSFDVPLTGERAANARIFVRNSDGAQTPIHQVTASALSIVSGPFFHPDDSVDVAVFRVKYVDPEMPWIPLGGHLDDWIGENDFVLQEAIVFGFPPIPMTTEPLLVVSRAEINAVIDVRHAAHVHFVLSTMARGGFSGGPAILGDYLLGVVTNSLLMSGQPLELGYFAVASVEGVFNCLCANKMLPKAQAEGWGTLWDDGLLAG